VAERSLELEGISRRAEISLALVGEEEIRELNTRYRGIEAPTDVLSFSQLEGDEEGRLPAAIPLVMGDVVICWPVAVRQAREFGHSLERECAYLLVHGILHLVGYDHQGEEEREVMRRREEEILGSVDPG
jgi:probable rRNA maturation factor